MVRLALGGVLCVVLGVTAALPDLIPIALAVTAVSMLGVVCLRAPERVVVGLIVWLVALGTLRRVLEATSLGGSSNALLLVAPITVMCLVAVAAHRGALRARTPLSNAVLCLTILVLLSALNPIQGGIAVGAGGLLFVLVPMLWFWLGRTIVSDRTLDRLLKTISVVSVPVAVYGLFQVYRGFPWWDRYWIDNKGYVALRVGDAFRQFASFASSSEYVGFLGIAALIWALRLRRLSRVIPASFVLLILGWALAVASARAILVALPIALGLVFAAGRGYSVAKSAILGLSALIILGAVVSRIDPTSVGGSRTSALLSRQIEGLSDPLNPEVSTLPGHVRDFTNGILAAFRNPLGRGVGSVTIAAEQFGGGSVNTEADPSNIAVGTGLAGLLTYCFVVVTGFKLAFRTASRRRSLPSLVALGVLAVTIFQWLNGGMYAVAPFPWLFLGWLDRQSVDRRSSPSENQPSVREAATVP